jgi:hypothetical protein
LEGRLEGRLGARVLGVDARLPRLRAIAEARRELIVTCLDRGRIRRRPVIVPVSVVLSVIPPAVMMLTDAAVVVAIMIIAAPMVATVLRLSAVCALEPLRALPIERIGRCLG